MPKFLIEREISGIGKLSPQELQAISQKSCEVLQGLGLQIQRLQSYVTDDKSPVGVVSWQDEPSWPVTIRSSASGTSCGAWKARPG